MPLQCPYCQIVQAKENTTCINCGKPLTPVPAMAAASAAPHADAFPPGEGSLAASSADPVHAAPMRRDSSYLPVLIGVGLLLAFVAATLWPHPHRPAPAGTPVADAATTSAPLSGPPAPLDLPAPPAPKPLKTEAASETKPAVTAKPAVVEPPPTIRLASTSAGKHVHLGEIVLLTALAGGRNATLTLFYQRGRGPKTMVGFAQGSLWSGPWVPPGPGKYAFAATALDDHRQSAVSNRIDITVDGPAPPRPSPRLSPALVKPAVKSAAVPSKPAVRAAPPAPPHAYHVAAAFFYFSRSAAVLADALSRRGYRAVPEKMSDAHGKTVYVVVTGTYRTPAEARQEVTTLQRSGYQAYFFSSP